MKLFRIVRQKYGEGLSGKGAALKGARWNSVGVELIYTASNRSLAMAELAVHFSVATMPDDYMMITINVPTGVKIKTLLVKDLPENWNVFPHPDSTQKIGDNFVIENKYCLLKIPSVVTQGDFNYLINPKHTDFPKITIKSKEKFVFDRRLFK